MIYQIGEGGGGLKSLVASLLRVFKRNTANIEYIGVAPVFCPMRCLDFVFADASVSCRQKYVELFYFINIVTSVSIFKSRTGNLKKAGNSPKLKMSVTFFRNRTVFSTDTTSIHLIEQKQQQHQKLGQDLNLLATHIEFVYYTSSVLYVDGFTVFNHIKCEI